MVRLTAGIWRGRKLAIPRGIRPTTGLAREAAFDILGADVVGARVLDACAGSGAYGLEALSRGAAHATFVEADREVVRVLRGNVERLGAGERASIEESSVARFSLKGEEGKRSRRAGQTERMDLVSVARFSSKVKERSPSVARHRAPSADGASKPHSPSEKSADSHPSPRAAEFDVIFHDPPFEEDSLADLQLLLPLVCSGGWLFHERGDDEILRPSGLEPADRRRYGTTRFLIFRPSGDR
ncbi:MAG TPA: RsmD family RNA methyltransferase [Thermoanaerobaculia bacterium]|nr:RsmD family RNA methyltransferase [Thermoanaerobaculia bacterium]